MEVFMKTWWKEEVVYQIYPKSFYDANKDGIGDVRGIIEKLPYLYDLGITMLWLCPIYASPMDDNGYDISDYKAIHPMFGTMKDVEELIEKAKKFNIKLIMDLVINHTSDEHAWFQEALRDPTSPYRQYYIFKEGRDGKEPTNWRSVFGGNVWEKVPNEKNMYYFHAFQKKQPCLNWENKEMRKEIYAMVNWWLDKGIAGFRVDAINFIKKNQDFPMGEVDGADGLANGFAYCRNQPGIEVFLKELKEQTFAKHDCVTVAEAYDVAYKDLGMYIDEVDGAFSMMFDFSYSNFDIGDHEEWFIRKDWTVQQFKKMILHSQMEIQKLGWAAIFLENHDQPRSITKLLPNEQDRCYESITMIAGMYFFMRGVPFIYQGEEIGMDNCERSSIEEFDDCSSRSQYERAINEGFSKEEAMHFVNLRSRDQARTPMQWSDEVYAGFSTKMPWLALNPSYKEVNVEKQMQDPHSILNFYKAMINLRQHSAYRDIFIYGQIQPIQTADENILAYERIYEGEHIRVYCNFQNQPTKALVKKEEKIVFQNIPINITQEILHLPAFAFVILYAKS